MSGGRFDALFATLAQQHDGVEALLDSFFDFMHRKTDFYVVTRDPVQRKMGFQPGHAQHKVLQAFLKYPFKDLDGSLATAQPPRKAASTSATSAPVAVRQQQQQQQQSTTVPSLTSIAPQAQPTLLQANPRPPPTTRPIERTASGKQVPVDNGGATDTYTWTQSLDETTVRPFAFAFDKIAIYVNVPPGTRSRDIECTITPTHVRVCMKADNKQRLLLLDGAVPAAIRADESLWSLERKQDSAQLQLSLEKVVQTWWTSAIAGDDEIDATQVDSTRRIDEYDSATQGAIRKAMFDQQQQQRGMPTSDALALEAVVSHARQAPHAPI